MDKIEKQKKHFNSISSDYVAGKKEPNYRLLKQLIWDEAFSYIEGDLGGRHISVLEPMCGDAEAYDLFKDRTCQFSYLGFDYSEEIVAKLNRDNPELDISLGDVTKFQSEKKFDVIIIIGGLHHVPDFAQAVIGNLAACLNDGGYFVNLEPTSGNPLFRWVRKRIYKKNKIFDEATERDFSIGELEGYFTNAGLKNHKALYPGLLSYILYYNPYAFPALNMGPPQIVKLIFTLEKWLFRLGFTKYFSFVTLGIWKK
jgi:SAM-dependent methyltransferase